MEYRYISGDSHLEVDSKWWLDRVPARYRDEAPRVIQLPQGGDAWVVADKPPREVPTDLYGGKGRERWQPFGQSYETTAGTGPASQRLAEQDQDGIDAEILFPGVSGPGLWRGIKDDAAYKSVVRAYNDWLAEDYCAENPDRLIGLGVLPWSGVDDAIAEMAHCAKLGLKGVHLGVFPSARGYPTPEDDKFWRAALDLHMPVAVHEQFNRDGERAGKLLDYPQASPEMIQRIGPSRELVGYIVKFGRLGGVNAIQLILDGVFDRFPDLRLFFAETQIGWLPFYLEMADVRYDRHSLWAEELLGLAQLDEPPSAYVKRHCYWGFQHDLAGIAQREQIGIDRIIWATDFPHQDSEWPHSMQLVDQQFAGVPAAETRRMVCDNAIEYFHLAG